MKPGEPAGDWAAIDIELYQGQRSALFPLFAQADDSSAAIQSYIEDGEVLVAQRAHVIVGHVQLIAGAGDWEVKSVAVIEDQRRRGIGGALVRAAVARAFSAGAARVVVATATADIDNLRFYQRLGFRMDRIEPDAFTVEQGYPDVAVDGIPVRDRVWFSIERSPR
jgi:ribosomal protein S18 acetylase RimI-like enzyme